MSMRNYYLSKVNEGLLLEDEKMVKKYEELILELDRQEYIRKTKELMKATK